MIIFTSDSMMPQIVGHKEALKIQLRWPVYSFHLTLFFTTTILSTRSANFSLPPTVAS